MDETWVRAFVAASMLLLLAAAASDLALRRVPNVVPALLGLIGIGFNVLNRSLPEGIIAATIVFATGLFCWHRGWMGGGDVKLLAAAALLVSPRLVPQLMLMVALAGGALAALYLMLQKLLPQSRVCARGTGRLRRFFRHERACIARGRLPYAAAIAAGTLVVLVR